MGVEQSRTISFPSNINENYSMYKEQWAKQNPFSGKTTFLSKGILIDASIELNTFIREQKITKLNILEVFAGTGEASSLLLKHIPMTIIKTDIAEFSGIEQLNAEDAVCKYKDSGVNTLLMISPPPGHIYGDYFCIKKWSTCDNAKYIIFVGELGASDGSEGLYKYLMEHKIWKLIHRTEISKSPDILPGSWVIKELFVFNK
jgi:hypothetical protein